MKTKAIYLTISILFATAYFLLWPTDIVFDDAAIILKYMDNFAAGHWFAYNATGEAVWGISSFLHGLISGLAAYSGLFSPDNSILISGIVGLVMISYFLLAIFGEISRNSIQKYSAWFFAMIAPATLFILHRQGLEIPLQAGFVLGSAYYLIKSRPALFGLFSALALITKYDSAGYILILFASYLIYHGVSRKHLISISIAFSVPFAGFLISVYLIFGQILPQSMLAKIYILTSDNGFADIIRLTQFKIGLIFLVLITSIAFLTYFQNRLEKFLSLDFIWIAMFFVHLIMYSIFNPAEIMPWYWSMPGLFLVVQLAVFLLRVADRLDSNRFFFGLLAPAFALGLFSTVVLTNRTINYLETVEFERILIGKYIRSQAQPQDTLYTGFGHIARQSGLFTVDYSGLNNKLPDLQNLNGKLYDKIQPDWICFQACSGPVIGEKGNYLIDRSFFLKSDMRNSRNVSPWRIYKRSEFNFDFRTANRSKREKPEFFSERSDSEIAYRINPPVNPELFEFNVPVEIYDKLEIEIFDESGRKLEEELYQIKKYSVVSEKQRTNYLKILSKSDHKIEKVKFSLPGNYFADNPAFQGAIVFQKSEIKP